MISLQSFVSTVTGHTDDMYENFLQLQNLFKVALSAVDNPTQLEPSMNQLIRSVADHYMAVNNLFHTFMHSKVLYLYIASQYETLFQRIHIHIHIIVFLIQADYLSTYIETESPAVEPSRWIEITESNLLQDLTPLITDSLGPSNVQR